MSNVPYLHSHSGIERFSRDKDIKNKSHVLVDAKFKHLFEDAATELSAVKYKDVIYYKVPTFAFVRKSGVFKNFNT